MKKVFIVFLLFNFLLASRSFAIEANKIDNIKLISDLQKGRLIFLLSIGNLQNGGSYLYKTNNSYLNLSQIENDTTRIKWEYLGPFIGAVVVTNASLYYLFKDAYWNEEKTKFHTFNDWNNADMNIDKIGHIYSGILLTKASYKILRLTNVPEKQAVIYSSLSSILFQTQVEFHDAYYKKWGWSWWDFAGNILGAIYPHLQTYFKPLKSINLKWSYHPSPAFKRGWYDYWIKDYEGFTYYLSFDVNSILPSKLDRFWPDWLNIAIAYGVEKVKLGKNIWNSSKMPLGDREWYVAFDYSLLKLFNPESKFLREILELLDNIHFPAPAIRITPSAVWYGIYF